MEFRQPILASLVEEANDVAVLVDLLVGVEVGFEALEIPISKLLKSGLHGSSQGGISIFQIALTLVGGLGSRCVVDLCTTTSACGRFSPGAGRGSSSSRAASATPATSLGRAGLLKGSVTHGGGAIQIQSSGGLCGEEKNRCLGGGDGQKR